ncbi:MAG TPA: hypothetical protein VGF29_05870 [Hyphomicrobiaceae bacterium]|jgi:hypothetical protein
MADDHTPTTEPRHDFGFRRITDYEADELDLAIRYAKEDLADAGLDFYSVLRGIDAYMEKRRRKQAGAAGRR